MPLDPQNPPALNPSPSPTFSQHASNNSLPTTPTSPYPFFTTPAASPFMGCRHRRFLSEMTFRAGADVGEPFNDGTASLEEFGHEEDPFWKYIDVDKIGGIGGTSISGGGGGGGCGDGGGGGERNDGDSGQGKDMTVIGMRKAMPPHKLAELWLVDPKRAKRISANRQSAARSKERKARYIRELERKVEALQTEVTTLTTHVSLYQRDTTDLTAENTELKRQLQSMERKAQLHDDLTEALKHEAQRLRIATEEIGNPSISLNLGVHHKHYCSSSSGSDYLQLPQSPGPAGHPKFQLSLFPSSPLSPSPRHIATPGPRPLAKHAWNDPVGRLQGLDISNREYIVQVECASISSPASESSSTTCFNLFTCQD